jgi:formate hydrogenlyase transcriptional activator
MPTMMERALCYRLPVERDDRGDVIREFRGASFMYAAAEKAGDAMSGIVYASSAFKDVLALVRTVASTDATVLITGESGTGKELVARAVHDLSARGSKGFVTLNCAAIPTGLLERELFGHERGAFTGAIASQIGRFEMANRGSLFLDEIAEMPLELQPKLLRVLQEREFERLGSIRTIRTDARIIAATNRELAAEVEDGEFRADLFYRLNIFPIHIPPLRERPEDIPLLTEHFVQLFTKRLHRVIDSIPASTMDALTRCQWPGNVRELRNVLERAVILSPGPVLQVGARDLQTCSEPARGADRSEKSTDRTLEAVERAHILSTLQGTGWVVGGPNGAAAVLGINRSTLQFRMKRLGISRRRSAGALAADSGGSQHGGAR